MSDESVRKAARKAREDVTDEVASQRAMTEATRFGMGRHSDKLGQDIVIETVQCHWYGTLVGVTELGGGAALAHLNPCWWISNTETLTPADASGHPKRVKTTDKCPADIYLTAAVIVSLPNDDWEHP